MATEGEFVEVKDATVDEPAEVAAPKATPAVKKMAFGGLMGSSGGGSMDLFSALKGGGALGFASKAVKKFRSLRSKADCVICFTSPSFYYNENEGFAELDVIRLGHLAGGVSCKWRTKDGEWRAVYAPCA